MTLQVTRESATFAPSPLADALLASNYDLDYCPLPYLWTPPTGLLTPALSRSPSPYPSSHAATTKSKQPRRTFPRLHQERARQSLLLNTNKGYAARDRMDSSAEMDNMAETDGVTEVDVDMDIPGASPNHAQSGACEYGA